MLSISLAGNRNTKARNGGKHENNPLISFVSSNFRAFVFPLPRARGQVGIQQSLFSLILFVVFMVKNAFQAETVDRVILRRRPPPGTLPFASLRLCASPAFRAETVDESCTGDAPLFRTARKGRLPQSGDHRLPPLVLPIEIGIETAKRLLAKEATGKAERCARRDDVSGEITGFRRSLEGRGSRKAAKTQRGGARRTSGLRRRGQDYVWPGREGSRRGAEAQRDDTEVRCCRRRSVAP